MPKRVHQKQKQKQKQTVVVNINSTKTRTKRKISKKTAGSQQQIIRQQIPPPIHQVYTSPIHNTVPQIFSSTGNRLNIPTLAEQQINNMLNPQSNAIVNSLSGSRLLTDYGSANSPSLNSLAYFKNQHSDSSLASENSSLRSDVSPFYTLQKLADDENKLKMQYNEETKDYELPSNPILREQPDNKSLASSINQFSLFDRPINAPRETPFIQRSMTDYFNVEQPQSSVEQTSIIEPPIFSGQVDEISPNLTYKMKIKKKKNPK